MISMMTSKLPAWDSRVSEAARKREIIDRVYDYHQQRHKEGLEKVTIKKASSMSARVFSKVIQSRSLMPFTEKSKLKTRIGTFEVMSAIVDSGVTVPMMNLSAGGSYEIRSGSANGTENEMSCGDIFEDL